MAEDDVMPVLGREDAMEILGEGVHTGLRKAAESAAAHQAWRSIQAMPDDEWGAVLAFVIDGLTSMGITLHRDESDA